MIDPKSSLLPVKGQEELGVDTTAGVTINENAPKQKGKGFGS